MFVDRIESGRIYLTSPPQYGCMYVTSERLPSEREKVRKSILRESGPIHGSSNENKVLKATAIAVALNDEEIKASNGLVVRGFIGRAACPGLQTALVGTRSEALRKRESPGWVVYVSPKGEFHNVTGRDMGYRFSPEQTRTLKECITHIKSEWMR